MTPENKVNINLELSDKEYSMEIIHQLALTRATVMAVGATLIGELAGEGGEKVEQLIKKMTDGVNQYLSEYTAEIKSRYSLNDNSIGKD